MISDIRKAYSENDFGQNEFDKILLEILEIIRNSRVPQNRKSLIYKLNYKEIPRDLIISVFEYIEDQRLADFFIKGYVITPFGRDYIRSSRRLNTNQTKLDFLGD